VAYLRVSSRSQSTETQRDAIERVASARHDQVDVWFEEHRTAKSLQRPILEELRKAVREGRVGVLYVYRIDRLSRSGIRDTFELVEEFRGRGVQIVTVADGFATDGPAMDVVLAVLAWAAQMERLAIGERISDAHARVKSAGLPWGRPRRVDRVTATQILEAHETGRSIRQLAVSFKVPRSTISRVVSQKPTLSDHSPRPVKKARDRGVSR
jgi:DNA invertase Pin-like site-specific DNA recombinase